MDPSLLPVPYSTVLQSPCHIFFVFPPRRYHAAYPPLQYHHVSLKHRRFSALLLLLLLLPIFLPHDTVSKLSQYHTQRQLHKASPSVECFGFRSFSFSFAVTTVRRILSLQLITCCVKGVSWTSIITAAMSVAPACTSTLWGKKK